MDEPESGEYRNYSAMRNESLNFTCDFGPSNDTLSAGGFSFGNFINGPVLACVIAVGLIGNTLCLMTLCRPSRLPQINQYLIALSLWDSALLISSFLVYNLPYLLFGQIVTHGDYVKAYPLCYTLSCASHMGSIWAVLVSAIDRYFALCRPLTHRLYSIESRTKCILFACAVMCLIFNMPKYLEISVGECYDVSTQKWTSTVSGSGLRANAVYWMFYKVIGGLLLFSVLPFILLTYLSVRVSCEARRLTSTAVPVLTSGHYSAYSTCPPSPSLFHPSANASKRVSFSETVVRYESVSNGIGKYSRSSLRRHSTSRRRGGDEPQYVLNFMLISVVLKFLICHTLPTILDVWESIMPTSMIFAGPVIDTLVNASNFLVVVNSSVNIFIYVWCSRRFRVDLAASLWLGRQPEGRRLRRLGDESTSTANSYRNARSPSLLSGNSRRASCHQPIIWQNHV